MFVLLCLVCWCTPLSNHFFLSITKKELIIKGQLTRVLEAKFKMLGAEQ